MNKQKRKGVSFELEILNQLQKLHTPVLDKIMVFITNLGSAGIIWIILTLVCLIIPRTRKVGWVMTASLIVDLILCNGILKNLVAENRPCDVNKSIQLLIKRPWDYSFPSGHTAASFASVTALYLAGEKKCGNWHWHWAVSLLFPECICMCIIRRIFWVV